MYVLWFHRTLVTAFVVTFSVCSACLAVESAASIRLFEQLDTNGDGLLNRAEIDPKHQRLFDRIVRQANALSNGELSLAEFLAGLTPRRPEKSLEKNELDRLPGADAIRLLYLKMDTNRDAILEANEVPVELLDVFDQLLETADRNRDDRLNSRELTMSTGPLSRVGRRIVSRLKIDVQRELDRLRRIEGDQFYRFDKQPKSRQLFENEASAPEIFSRLDADGNGLLEFSEVPGRFGPLFQQFLKQADRDQDKSLSRQEFLEGAGRLKPFLEMAESP
jgi:hypothetical protein